MNGSTISDGFLDTSVIVRYLTDDPPAMAAAAARLIDSDVVLTVSPVVLAEVAYVLTSVYKSPRDIVVDALTAFLQRENIVLQHLDKGLAIQALLLARPSGRVSFADAMIWAAARSSEMPRVYTFDLHFPAEGIETVSPQ
jgi:predicted nucleic acid-binding protein